MIISERRCFGGELGRFRVLLRSARFALVRGALLSWRWLALRCRFLAGLGPGILEGDDAVGDERAGLAIWIGVEEAEALELEAIAALRSGEARLAFGSDDLERMRIQVFDWIAPAVPRCLDGEQSIVETDLNVHRGLGAHPVNGAVDTFAVGRSAATRGGVVGAVDLGDFALLVLDDPRASDDVGVAQAHRAPGREPVIAGGRILQEVVALDEECA